MSLIQECLRVVYDIMIRTDQIKSCWSDLRKMTSRRNGQQNIYGHRK